MPEPILSCDFSFQRGQFDLQFETNIHHEFTALFGPSGCGKTTILRCIAGLYKPIRGYIRFQNELVFAGERKINLSPRDRRIGLVFQDSRLFPHLSVTENLAFSRNFLSETPRFTFDDIVELLGIRRLLDRNPLSLSGGERQRVALGRALLASPRLLLMDEPFAALDQPTKFSLLTSLRRIHKELDLPIIYVSHDISTVINIASRVLSIKAGRIVADGAPFTVLKDYFSSGMQPENIVQNIFEAQITARDLTTHTCTCTINGHNFTLPNIEGKIGERFFIDIPASEIILATQKPSGLSARNILPGGVQEIQWLGERIIVNIDTGIPFSVEIVEKTLDDLKIKIGERVYLVIKATAFRRVS